VLFTLSICIGVLLFLVGPALRMRGKDS
jgi:hypothetical protein